MGSTLWGGAVLHGEYGGRADGRLTTSVAATVVLVGTLVRWADPLAGAGLVVTGEILGMLPTAWTLVIPVFAFAGITLTVIDAGSRHDAQQP